MAGSSSRSTRRGAGDVAAAADRIIHHAAGRLGVRDGLGCRVRVGVSGSVAVSVTGLVAVSGLCLKTPSGIGLLRQRSPLWGSAFSGRISGDLAERGGARGAARALP